ncbi:unnamed protein product, partial [Mesorhabditis belari]|uniref:tRNA (cytosine(34)-C(5))-methyltransferase n=1 Tax=Mesorhabditis belari TaxID=2138241 RepID=A0AAF3F485_9BILA
MGKKKNNSKKHQNRSKSNGNRTDNYVPVEKTNEKYWNFYKAQALFPEDEWDSFVQHLRRDLPSSFRVQGCHKDREQLIKEMETRFFQKIRESSDASVFAPVELPWYPGVYQTRMSRTEVRSHPILAELHNFLVTEAELGSISRQETVSMIPPLLLNPSKEHFVLDMCAAPGSKTMQLIEIMHEDDLNPPGMIVANDVDKKRCYMLIHQTLKRMKNANTVVINEDATRLPDMELDGKVLKFDRVLCDVICSGDGTVRKNPDIWEKWSPQEGIGLHRLQLSIARRGVEQLAIGGQLVYSTCSMNPIEDEAVVAQLLREANGALKLVDAHPLLPKLKALRGVNNWKVFTRDMKLINSFEEVPEELKRPFCKSMFPPSEEEAKEMHLDYTMRIVPHLQDTGGFFVALLEKVEEFTFVRERETTAKGATWRKKLYKDDPFTFLKENDERWHDLQNHYGISDDFHYQNLFNRMLEDQNSRQLFYANDAVKNFLKSNMKKVSIQNAGMRMFGRNDNKVESAKFRVSQEGIRTILSYMSKQVLKISEKDMLTILRHEESLVPLELLDSAEEMRSFVSGSLVAYFNKEDPVCCWIGQKTCAPYISKEEKIHLLRMLGENTEVIENLMRNKRREKAIAGRNAQQNTGEGNDEEQEKNFDQDGNLE